MISQNYPKQCSVFAAAEDFVLWHKKQNNKQKGNTKKGLDCSQNL